MLGIDRDDFAAADFCGLSHQVTSHDQCFFVGQRHSLPGIQRGQSCRQTSRSDHGIHHDIHAGMADGVYHTGRPAGDFPVARPRRSTIDQSEKLGTRFPTLLA